MKFRHTFLICRAAAFALLLATAGVTSVAVAGGAQDARQTVLAGTPQPAGFTQAQIATATTGGGAGLE